MELPYDFNEIQGSSYTETSSDDAEARTIISTPPAQRLDNIVDDDDNSTNLTSGWLSENSIVDNYNKKWKSDWAFDSFTREGSKVKVIVKGWWREILSCALSIAVFITLVLALKRFDGEPLPRWPSGITVNTLVAFLSTLARSALLVPVTEGISQSKWNWFTRKPRPLQDFEIFDQASRGASGSFNLLFRTKGWLAGVLSAFLLISGAATSTLTQSAVTYPSRNIALPQDGRSTAWRLTNVFLPDYLGTDVSLNSPISRAIARAVYAPTEKLPFKEPHCTTSDCTWPHFSTLAVCHNVTNITDLVRTDPDWLMSNTNETSILSWEVVPSLPGNEAELSLRSGPNLTYKSMHMSEGSIFKYFAIYSFAVSVKSKVEAVNFTMRSGLRVMETDLHWCIKTFNFSVSDKVHSTTEMTVDTRVHQGIVEPFHEWLEDAWSRKLLENITYLTSPEEDQKFVIGGINKTGVVDMLRNSLTGSSDGSASYETPTAADLLRHVGISAQENIKKTPDILSEAAVERIWSASIESMAANVANGLTNSFIDTWPQDCAEIINGTSYEREVYVAVRWQWLALLALQIVLSITVLFLVIVETAVAGIDIVKTSTIVSLFAINSEEKSNLEHLREGGKCLDKKLDDTQLLPARIGGKLRWDDGKWILGGQDK